MRVVKTFLFLLFSLTTVVYAQEYDYIREIKPCEVSIQACIEEYFPEDPKLATAVFMAESSLKPNKIGYNCRYGKVISSCAVQDRHLAISKDYGIAQINDQHSKHPEEFLDLETCLKMARKLYRERGDTFDAWFAYKNKLHLKYL